MQINIQIQGDLVHEEFDVPVVQIKPRRFQAFTMPDSGGFVAVCGKAEHRFVGEVFMPAYDEREGAVNAL